MLVQSHYSTKGAGAVCGFGTDNVKEVPCDERCDDKLPALTDISTFVQRKDDSG